MGHVRISYTAKFKLEVVKYAEENGKREAGRKYDIDSKNVRSWMNQKISREKTNRNRHAFRVKKQNTLRLKQTC